MAAVLQDTFQLGLFDAPLGAEILRPHPDPHRPRPILQQPPLDFREQLPAPPTILVRRQHVQTLQLAIALHHVLMRQPARPGGRMAHGHAIVLGQGGGDIHCLQALFDIALETQFAPGGGDVQQLAPQRVVAAQEKIRSGERLLSEAKAMFRQGRLPEADVWEVENALARFQSAVSEARQGERERINRLRTQLQRQLFHLLAHSVLYINR